ncbi:MAG: hypothetical protein ACLUDQ_11195 [Bilophila wadsworthia]
MDIRPLPRLAEREGQLPEPLRRRTADAAIAARSWPTQGAVLDEPSRPCALLVRSIFDSVRKINRQGVTVILVEQNARAALKLASRGYVIEVGRVVMEDASEALLANPDAGGYLGGGQENGQEN